MPVVFPWGACPGFSQKPAPSPPPLTHRRMKDDPDDRTLPPQQSRDTARSQMEIHNLRNAEPEAHKVSGVARRDTLYFFGLG